MYSLNKVVGDFMQNVNTTNQNPDKIVDSKFQMTGSLTCFNDDNQDGIVIQLTSLEEMWYTHEENVDHPVGSEYPVSINVPHMKLMRDRVIDSVFNRTGINVKDYDGVIHASSSGPDHGHNLNVVRNV
jgi:predicted double-glycine peptidase